MDWKLVEKDSLPKYIEPMGIVRPNTYPLAIVDWDNPNQYLVYTSLGAYELADFEKDGSWGFNQVSHDEIVICYLHLPPKPPILST